MQALHQDNPGRSTTVFAKCIAAKDEYLEYAENKFSTGQPKDCILVEIICNGDEKSGGEAVSVVKTAVQTFLESQPMKYVIAVFMHARRIIMIEMYVLSIHRIVYFEQFVNPELCTCSKKVEALEQQVEALQKKVNDLLSLNH